MKKNILKYEKPIVIAEIGCNHKGDINIAKQMIATIVGFCEVFVAKFQKRTPKELLSSEEYAKPHPNHDHSYGTTYGKHREYLEFSKNQHRELKKFCENMDVEYFTSVWDLTSAREIIALKPKRLKIPSACNTDQKLLQYVCKHFKGEIHVSLGMTTKKEEKEIIDIFQKHKRLKDLVLYVCTSGYPVPFEQVCLLEISRLQDKYGKIIKGIGFSGHHLGISIDIAAYTLGARYIERHFTLDRTWKGTDHAASLEPDMLRRLNRDLLATYKSLTFKDTEVLEIEIEQRKKLKRHVK